ncbi:MAG UNVERIFIED_CONTAM: hypothetical protein LVR29_16015 [Microcystis novacekii LVE1205-3]|jgi:twitching motility protein PilJ
MPSGTEYAKLYGQANIAYCQGNLEDAAVIIKDMIGKYPDDANVVAFTGSHSSRTTTIQLGKETLRKSAAIG